MSVSLPLTSEGSSVGWDQKKRADSWLSSLCQAGGCASESGSLCRSGGELVARCREQAERPLPNFVADWKDSKGVDEADAASVTTCPCPSEQPEDAGLCDAFDDEEPVGK